MGARMRFSLVVATLGRTEDLRALFASLADQTIRDFEVILVDQNHDDRLVPIVVDFAGRLDIRHLRSPVRCLSHARNVGLLECRGAIVGFPDDDCLYPPGVLALVDARFAADPTLDMLTGPAQSPTGGLGSGRWAATSGPITLETVWKTVIAFNLFVRRDLLQRIGGFDDDLGVGARFGACEETDLAIRGIKAGAKGFYDTELRVVHPDKRLTPAAVARAFNYGTGTGRVLRKHDISTRIVLTFFVRPLGGVVQSLLQLRAQNALYYWRTLRGRAAGYHRAKKCPAGLNRPGT